MTVTPVRTSSPDISVVWPTRTPATSVMASSGPGANTPGARPISRARGRADWAASDETAANANSAATRRFDMTGMIRSRSFMRQIPLAAIKEAAESVYQAALPPPLVRPALPFRDVGASPAEIYLKLELLQPIGSFKIRGAWNAVRALPRHALEQGVWTVSAGNAAQGVGVAA